MKPRITIGLPCLNAADTIELAVQSIFAQTFTDWELIIVDDGSTDGTQELISRFAAPGVRVLVDGKNRKLGARLNQIADEAAGDVLVRMDSDDVMFPERLEKQLNILDRHADCDLVGSGIVSIDSFDIPVSHRLPPTLVQAAKDIFRGEVVYHPTVMGRTEWFRRNRYNESLPRGEDFELWCRTAGEITIRNLPEPLLFYREFRQFSYRQYCLSSTITRNVIRQYGHEKIGAVPTLRLIWRRRLKDLAYWGLWVAGQSNLALRLRASSIPEKEMAHYRAVLDKIRTQSLPTGVGNHETVSIPK